MTTVFADIGEYLQEFDAFGLTAIEDVESAASNYLTYAKRPNTRSGGRHAAFWCRDR